MFSVIKPLIQHTEEVLASPDLQRDPDHFSPILASSIAAIAFLSKAYSRQAPPHVKSVLLETIPISLNVLKSLPSHELVRNKMMIYLQRMILCLRDQILFTTPDIDYVLPIAPTLNTKSIYITEYQILLTDYYLPNTI